MAVWKQTVLQRATVLCVTCHHSPNDINGPKAWRPVPRLADRWTLHYCMVHVYRMIETDLEGDKSRRKIFFLKNMNIHSFTKQNGSLHVFRQQYSSSISAAVGR